MSSRFLMVALVSGVSLLTACATESAPPDTAADTTAEWQVGLDPEIAEALSELPEEDRQAALKQGVCPVTQKPLGSMGPPMKIVVEGQEVFLCCEGCESMIRSSPEKYLPSTDE